METTKVRYTSSQIMKFVLPSLVGFIAFLMPIPDKGTLNTILGLMINEGKAIFNDYLPATAMVIVCSTSLFSLYAVLTKPKFVMENEFLRSIFITTPFWLGSRLLGAALYIPIFFKIGPEIIWSDATGGTMGITLVPLLVIVFIVLSAIVPFLTDYGLMEYVGTFARPVMRPLFKLPGRAAVDCLASWIGSSSVAVVITTSVHDRGYYTDREAAVIATSFSVISIAYIYVMAEFVKLPHMYFQILLSVYIVSLLLALIMPRVWPLKGVADTFSGRAGQQRTLDDDVPKGFALKDWALKQAVEKAGAQTTRSTILSIGKTLLSLCTCTMPVAISWGTVVLMIVESTQFFQTIALPFAWLLELVRIPEAGQVAVAFVLAYPDQFLAAVIGAGLSTDAARFMCAGISATGLVYLTETGVLIINSSIPLGLGKLTGIYLIRAVLSVFLLAPFAWYFCM